VDWCLGPRPGYCTGLRPQTEAPSLSPLVPTPAERAKEWRLCGGASGRNVPIDVLLCLERLTALEFPTSGATKAKKFMVMRHAYTSALSLNSWAWVSLSFLFLKLRGKTLLGPAARKRRARKKHGSKPRKKRDSHLSHSKRYLPISSRGGPPQGGGA